MVQGQLFAMIQPGQTTKLEYLWGLFSIKLRQVSAGCTSPFCVNKDLPRDHPIFSVLSLLEILAKHRSVGTKRQMVGRLEALIVGLGGNLPVSSRRLKFPRLLTLVSAGHFIDYRIRTTI